MRGLASPSHHLGFHVPHRCVLLGPPLPRFLVCSCPSACWCRVWVWALPTRAVRVVVCLPPLFSAFSMRHDDELRFQFHVGFWAAITSAGIAPCWVPSLLFKWSMTCWRAAASFLLRWTTSLVKIASSFSGSWEKQVLRGKK